MTPHPGSTVIARDAWVPFDETLEASADVEWWIRLSAVAPVVTVPRIGCVIRRHRGSRHGNDAAARLEALEQIRQMHADYFATHRRADAFHLFRIGLQASGIGERRRARAAMLQSFRRRPGLRPVYFAARMTVSRRPVG